MGFFSYITQDTNESVTNQYYEGTPSEPFTKTAYIIDHLGNTYGGVYDGYGRFMTRKTFKESRRIWSETDLVKTPEEKRKLYYQHEEFLNKNSYTYDQILEQMPEGLVPNVVRNPISEWVNERPEDCYHQGWFY